MPGWYKVCQIGRSEQQVHLQHLLHLEVRVHFWLVYSCVQFAVPADWEAPGNDLILTCDQSYMVCGL